MTVKTVTYSRTYNLGNYESVKVEFGAEFETEPTQDQINEALDTLAMHAKSWVEKRFGPRLNAAQQR